MPYVTTKAHGTGLGLAIVKKMVDEHSGQIKIENNPSGGACVTIILPLESDYLKHKNIAHNIDASTSSNSQNLNGNTQQKSVRKV
jgi:Histidine kinase-, DNA gyrase B-, and HSP90-like ATPase